MKTAKNKYEYIKKWKLEHPEKTREYKRKYHQKNSNRLLKYKKIWKIDNPEYDKNYQRKRRTNTKHRIDDNISNAMRRCLKGVKDGRKWECLVNYTVNDLIKHLENLFDDKMNWDNYGSYWVVDHIKPKSLFKYKTTEDEEFEECWALENLQPLEKMENLRKYNHY